MEPSKASTDQFYTSDGSCTSWDDVSPSTHSYSSTSDDVTVNLLVCGRKFSIGRSALLTFPHTRLGQLGLRHRASEKQDQQHHAYVFDRNSDVMNSVLDLYRTGELHLPGNMCSLAIYRELKFWGIDDRLVSECCWKRYKDAFKELLIVDQLEKVMDQEEVGGEGWRKWVWMTMERPGYNKLSWVWLGVYMIFIFFSIGVMCAASVKKFRIRIHEESYLVNGGKDESTFDFILSTKLSPPLAVLDLCGLIFFTLEPTLRLVTCPDLGEHLSQCLNILDLVLAADHWACMAMEHQAGLLDERGSKARILHAILRAGLSLRVVRVFHIARRYNKMKVLLLTFQASVAELVLLSLGVFIAVIVYATLIYYAELTEGADNFQNIPQAIWWAIVTMATVGYGDFYPTTLSGYIVGIFCSLSGLLLLSMPIAIIANNFSSHYSGLVALDQRSRRARYLADQTVRSLKENISRTDTEYKSAKTSLEQTVTCKLQAPSWDFEFSNGPDKPYSYRAFSNAGYQVDTNIDNVDVLFHHDRCYSSGDNPTSSLEASTVNGPQSTKYRWFTSDEKLFTSKQGENPLTVASEILQRPRLRHHGTEGQGQWKLPHPGRQKKSSTRLKPRHLISNILLSKAHSTPLLHDKHSMNIIDYQSTVSNASKDRFCSSERLHCCPFNTEQRQFASRHLKLGTPTAAPVFYQPPAPEDVLSTLPNSTPSRCTSAARHGAPASSDNTNHEPITVSQPQKSFVDSEVSVSDSQVSLSKIGNLRNCSNACESRKHLDSVRLADRQTGMISTHEQSIGTQEPTDTLCSNDLDKKHNKMDLSNRKRRRKKKQSRKDSVAVDANK